MTATKMIEHTLIFFIRAYQHTIGALIPRVCRYEPTCSQYSIEAIREHGIFRGLGLSAWRIIRCNPWCQGGHDPVPVKHKAGMSGCGDSGIQKMELTRKSFIKALRLNSQRSIKACMDDTMKNDPNAINALNALNDTNAINDPNDLNVFYHRKLMSDHCNRSAEGRS